MTGIPPPEQCFSKPVIRRFRPRQIESRGNLNHASGSRPSNGLLCHGLLTVNLPHHESRNSPSLTQLEKRCATGVEDMRELAERKNPCSFGDGDAEIG